MSHDMLVCKNAMGKKQTELGKEWQPCSAPSEWDECPKCHTKPYVHLDNRHARCNCPTTVRNVGSGTIRERWNYRMHKRVVRLEDYERHKREHAKKRALSEHYGMGTLGMQAYMEAKRKEAMLRTMTQVVIPAGSKVIDEVDTGQLEERMAAKMKAQIEEQAYRALCGEEHWTSLYYQKPDKEVSPQDAMLARDEEGIAVEEPGARRLTRAGGTDPGLKSIPRRRIREHPITGHIAVYPTDEGDISEGDWCEQYQDWQAKTHGGLNPPKPQAPGPKRDVYAGRDPDHHDGDNGDKWTNTHTGAIFTKKSGTWSTTGHMSADPNHPERKAADHRERIRTRDSRNDYKPESDEFKSGDDIMDATKGMF